MINFIHIWRGLQYQKSFFEVVKAILSKHILDVKQDQEMEQYFGIKFIEFFLYMCRFQFRLLKKAETKTSDIKNKKFVLIDKLNDNEVLKENFQLILCYETIEHVYEYSELLNMLSKVLDKNGLVILTTQWLRNYSLAYCYSRL